MRALRQITIVMVLGAVTTILVAWSFAIWKKVPMYAGTPAASLPRPRSYTFVAWDRPWQANEITGFGFDDIWWLDLHADNPGEDPATLVANSRAERASRQAGPRFAHVVYSDNPPPWGTFGREHPPPENLIGSDTAYGWPLPCMWYQVVGQKYFFLLEGNTEYGDFIYGAWFLGGQLDSVSHDYTAIPLRPMWKPLLVNVGFYALIWWLLLFAPGRLRRALRRQRGACPQCGYALRGELAQGCPECGWNRAGPR